jgi:hypothetical protein
LDCNRSGSVFLVPKYGAQEILPHRTNVWFIKCNSL